MMATQILAGHFSTQFQIGESGQETDEDRCSCERQGASGLLIESFHPEPQVLKLRVF